LVPVPGSRKSAVVLVKKRKLLIQIYDKHFSEKGQNVKKKGKKKQEE
jgi:hypothetical protein